MPVGPFRFLRRGRCTCDPISLVTRRRTCGRCRGLKDDLGTLKARPCRGDGRDLVEAGKSQGGEAAAEDRGGDPGRAGPAPRRRRRRGGARGRRAAESAQRTSRRSRSRAWRSRWAWGSCWAGRPPVKAVSRFIVKLADLAEAEGGAAPAQRTWGWRRRSRWRGPWRGWRGSGFWFGRL